MRQIVRANHALLAAIAVALCFGCADQEELSQPVGPAPSPTKPPVAAAIASPSPVIATPEEPSDRNYPTAVAVPDRWRRYVAASGLTAESLNGVWMNDEFTEGWAVGDAGEIMRYAAADEPER